MFKSLKKIILIFIVCLIACPFTVTAHSGRTDSSGCHTNKKTGEYHCHEKTAAVSVKSAKTESRVKAKTNFSCETNIYNCADFNGHTEAQTVYDLCLSEVKKDIHDLDRDNDGLACE